LKKRKSALTIPLFIVLFVALLVNQPFFPNIRIVWASGSSDSYGNRIIKVNCQQYNGSAWVGFTDYYTFDGTPWNETFDVTEHEYFSGQDWWHVAENQSVRFGVVVFYNRTLAATTTQACAYTRVYINITKAGYSLTNQLFTSEIAYAYNATYWQVASFYTWAVAGEPESTGTYEVTLEYESYT
jgi:hypothetical protein